MHDPPEWPECTTPLGGEAPAPTGERKVLAREGGPGQSRSFIQFSGGHIGDILTNEVPAPEIRDVDGFLLWVDVVGPNTVPSRSQPARRKSGTRKKIVELRQIGSFCTRL